MPAATCQKCRGVGYLTAPLTHESRKAGEKECQANIDEDTNPAAEQRPASEVGGPNPARYGPPWATSSNGVQLAT